MFKKIIPIVALLSFSIVSADSAQAVSKNQKKAAQKASAPFLIVDKMPHLTKMVKMNWDNKSLNLSDKQKKELVKVREETISGVTRLKKEINILEDAIAAKIMSGTKPQELKSDVDKVAALKVEATMVHLNCIYNTKKILTKEQLKFISGD